MSSGWLIGIDGGGTGCRALIAAADDAAQGRTFEGTAGPANPKPVGVEAARKAMKEAIANPAAAIDLLAKNEALIKKDIEKRRMLYVYKTLIDTPESRSLGVGDVSDERMAGAAATIAESFELPRVPKPADVFSRDFLPAKADRMPTVLSN